MGFAWYWLPLAAGCIVALFYLFKPRGRSGTIGAYGSGRGYSARPSPPPFPMPRAKPEVLHLADDDGAFEGDVVGESHYQENLSSIAGGSDEGAEYECVADLIPEPSNPHDNKAIRVDINGLTVGYIPADETAEFHALMRGMRARCPALIVGGWERGVRGRGHFGVRLDIGYPPALKDRRAR